MSDWDAAKYPRISDPQLAWGRSVAARPSPTSGEHILDLGCGTGRLTEEIAATPGIFVVGLDRSASIDPPLTLDYWRLDISARKAAA